MNKDNCHMFLMLCCLLENATRMQNTTLKTYGKLSLFIFLHYINIWGQKVQNSVFYEAFLPITCIKPSVGVTKLSKCMGSHVA